MADRAVETNSAEEQGGSQNLSNASMGRRNFLNTIGAGLVGAAFGANSLTAEAQQAGHSTGWQTLSIDAKYDHIKNAIERKGVLPDPALQQRLETTMLQYLPEDACLLGGRSTVGYPDEDLRSEFEFSGAEFVDGFIAPGFVFDLRNESRDFKLTHISMNAFGNTSQIDLRNLHGKFNVFSPSEASGDAEEAFSKNPLVGNHTHLEFSLNRNGLKYPEKDGMKRADEPIGFTTLVSLGREARTFHVLMEFSDEIILKGGNRYIIGIYGEMPGPDLNIVSANSDLGGDKRDLRTASFLKNGSKYDLIELAWEEMPTMHNLGFDVIAVPLQGQEATETPTPSPTATPTTTPTASPTSTPSPTATPTPSPSATATPTVTPTPTNTATPTPTQSVVVEPKATRTPQRSRVKNWSDYR